MHDCSLEHLTFEAAQTNMVQMVCQLKATAAPEEDMPPDKRQPNPAQDFVCIVRTAALFEASAETGRRQITKNAFSGLVVSSVRCAAGSSITLIRSPGCFALGSFSLA
jgi:hypothetical protein|eukprot:COSAG03_NODE_1567_length_3864_cov_5.719657_2_plen_108_part_00